MKTLVKQFKARPLLNIFFVLCLIITAFAVSILKAQPRELIGGKE